MKRDLIFITSLVLFISNGMFSQHTQKFKEITKNLIAIDSSENQYYYTDGAIKKTAKSRVYKTPSYSYSKDFGKVLTYYKSGELKSEQELDNYGNELSVVFYNQNGTTWWKSETLEIDSKLEDATNFFMVTDHIKIVKKLKEYKFGKEIGTMYLKEEGKVSNGKKFGVWKIYDEYGRIKEEINFDS